MAVEIISKDGPEAPKSSGSGRNHEVIAISCGGASMACLVFTWMVHNAMLFVLLAAALACGIVSLVFARKAKKAGVKSGMRTAGFWLGLLGTIFSAIALLVMALTTIAAIFMARALMDDLKDGSIGITASGEPGEAMHGSGALGDYYVEIKGAAAAEDYEGKPAIIMTYAWTNNSEDTTSAWTSVFPKAFQDGVQLETAWITDEGYDGDAESREARPGTTLDIQKAYVLGNTSSLVEFELTEFLGFSDSSVTETFDISRFVFNNANLDGYGDPDDYDDQGGHTGDDIDVAFDPDADYTLVYNDADPGAVE